MDVITRKLCSLGLFVRSSPVDLEVEILTILQPSGIKKLNELPACVTNYLSLCSVYLELHSRTEYSIPVAFGFEQTRSRAHKKFRRYELMAVLQRDIKCCHVRHNTSLETKFSSLLQEGPTTFLHIFYYFLLTRFLHRS